MKNFIIFFIGLCLVLGGFLYYMGQGSTKIDEQTKPEIKTEEINKTETKIEENNNGLAMANDAMASKMATNTIIAKSKTMEENKKQDFYKITIKTNKGNIELLVNAKVSPNTALNFVNLANSNFYNGTKFHRVINGFMIQGGDPKSKEANLVNEWGTGGAAFGGGKFADELEGAKTFGYKRGTLAMANSGPNTNGSQFFIMHKDMSLPPLYSVFGHVTAGLETLDAIAAVKVNGNDRPLDDVVIESVTVSK